MSYAFSLPLLKAPQKSMAVGAAGGAERTNVQHPVYNVAGCLPKVCCFDSIWDEYQQLQAK